MRAPNEVGVQYPTISIVVEGSSIWLDTWCLMRPASSIPEDEMMIQYFTACQDVKQIKHTFIVHGESNVQKTYQTHLQEAGFGMISIPQRGDCIEI